ncbi:glycerophosphodiester phosphodiesterase 1 isoform X2 [Manduca sexta]|uniref:glycerophosphodiester phosphodiesterase 1 isoform X2 n=1 Tax=Manduca sexta TaxID=7130 RepID=UPI00188E4F87|nr:glycerophosphodiester phosphodiesterase 1 isoform X2 [Manduca sexta]
MTEVGMCLSFNSVYAQYQYMLYETDWQPTQLLKCHYHSGQCYVRIDSSNTVRYFIHSPFEISTAISNPTGEVSPGEELIIDFKAVEIQASSSVKYLRPEQRRCRYPDEWIHESIKAYSFALCQMHCRSQMAVMFCGCRPFFHVKGVLPFGLDVGLLGVSAYYMTKLRKPEQCNVVSIFGPEPWSKEAEENPEKVVRCIAHRGAGLDAPENTLEAFKYCVERDCNFIELDVRTSRDGRLVLLHDQGLERLAGADITNVHLMDWENINTIDIGATHPNRHLFKEVHLCLLDEALDYLLENKVRMIIDVKGEDSQVVSGILKAYSTRPTLYQYAAVTCFNPYILYQIRKKDPEIVGAMSYRPYGFSAADYDAENGPTNPRFNDNVPLHAALRVCDALHALVWRWAARWCNVSAVLLHKDIVSPSEVHYWRQLGVRCAGWCVNRPLEKLYWRGVLRAPYLANTLLGEPDMETHRRHFDTTAKQKTIKDME